MKKRFLTFVMSYLLLAAFIGSAEAITIDTTYDAGAGLIQLAADPSSSILTGGTANTGLTLDGTDDGMEGLLAFYYGIEAESDLITLENTSPDSTDEVPPTSEEYDEDFSPGEGFLFGYNLAGLVYGDRLVDQTADTPIASDQTSASGTTSGKVPVIRYETIPFKYYDPPTIVYLKDPTQPKTDPIEPPVFPAEPVKPPPLIPQIPIPDPAGPPPEDLVYDPLNPGPDKIPPDNNIVNPPAPVPEPATMLLFSAGIAGLAFSNLRRNKNIDTRKRVSKA